MSNETSSGAVVYFEENGTRKYLILHYVESHFDFPKGHVEGIEKLEETALREIREETGLTVDLNPSFKEHITYFFKNREGLVVQKTVYFFVGKAHSDQVTLSHEHIGYLWLSYEHALKKLTFDNAKEVLKKAEEFLLQKKLDSF